MLNKNKELNNMKNITEIDTRFCLSTIRLMHVWVYGYEMAGGKSYDSALMTMKSELGEKALYDMKVKADAIVNYGLQSFNDAIEQGVK